MKKLKCDMCDVVAEGETFEQWMQNLMPHYMQAHPEVMNDTTKTKEDQMQWMEQNKLRFDTTSEM
jgi:predicted RNase H-like HicB family nuclease